MYVDLKQALGAQQKFTVLLVYIDDFTNILRVRYSNVALNMSDTLYQYYLSWVRRPAGIPIASLVSDDVGAQPLAPSEDEVANPSVLLELFIETVEINVAFVPGSTSVVEGSP